MNLQENIIRIREIMGLITENIDDVLDKMNRGEELSQEDKDKMEKYTKHLQSGGSEEDFYYNPEVSKKESKDVDYNSLIEQLLYEYYDETYKDYFYVYGTKEREKAFPELEKTLKSIYNPEDEDDIKPTELNRYIMVGHQDSKHGENYYFPTIVSSYDLLSSEKNLFFWPYPHHTGFKKYIKNYIDNRASQSVKDLYYNNEGALYDWAENTDYKTEDKPRIIKVFLKWFKDKFGEFFDEGDVIEKGPTTQQMFFLKEFIKENGIDGYIKDL